MQHCRDSHQAWPEQLQLNVLWVPRHWQRLSPTRLHAVAVSPCCPLAPKPALLPTERLLLPAGAEGTSPYTLKNVTCWLETLSEACPSRQEEEVEATATRHV